MSGWLTPDAIPPDTICRALFIPNNEEFIAVVTGALQNLISPSSWQLYGTLTPQQSADALVDMFDAFCFNQGACRVIGEIIQFAGASSPDSRWLACDGASLLRSDYPDLFTIIGTTYGAIDGTHFSLPDLRGRVPMDAGAGPGLSARAAGDSLGEEMHILTVGELATHTHTDSGHSHAIGTDVPTGTAVPPPLDAGLTIPFPASSTGTASANIQNTGTDTPHNNIQPSLVITFLIVALA